MRKKVLKNLKFILCIMIISSLMVPSYAAISSTDGSAFITKAEYDAAMALYDSRLNTVESDIDSKIDSQITRYLEKNELWVATEQKCLAPSGWKWNIINYAIYGSGSATYDLHNIFTASKSGLCYMTHKYKINKQNAGGYEWQNTWGDIWTLKSDIHSANVFDSTEAWYIVENGTTKILSYNVLGGTPKCFGVGDNNPMIGPLWVKVPSDVTYPSSISFFVHKGITYGVQLIQYYYMDTTYVNTRLTTYTGQMEVYDFKIMIY